MLNKFSRLLSKITSPSSSRGIIGAVLLPLEFVDKKSSVHRIEALMKQLKLAGIEDRLVVVPDGLSRETMDAVAGKTVSASQFVSLCNQCTLVMIRVDQYHVSHEWIVDMVDRANSENVSLVHENHSSPLVGNLRLSCALTVIHFRVAKRVLSEMLRSSFFGYADQRHLFEAKRFAHSVLGLNAQNVASLYRQAAEMDLPISFVVETNSSCNYHCLMCPYHGGRQKSKPTFLQPGTYVDMPITVFKRVIDEIAALERKFEEDSPVTVSPYRRGEFLLYPHWKEALQHIKSKSALRAFFSSNGSLWGDEDVNFVVDCGLDQLQISVEGHDLKSHRKLRLNDEFDKVVSTIRKIMQAKQLRNVEKPVLQLAHTINERNFKLVKDYVGFWIGKVDALFLGPENYADDVTYNKRYKAEFSPVQPRPISDRPPCQMIKDCVWIDAEGTVILCIGAKQELIGNVHENSLAEILASPKRLEVLAQHASGRYSEGVCNNCEQWYSAYGETHESDDYSLFLSPDTQYYKSKKIMNVNW